MNLLKRTYSRLTRMSWHLGFVVNGLDGVFSDSPEVMWVKSPYRDRWFADPFILDVTDSKIVLLVEEFRFACPVGRIAKLTVDKKTMALEDMQIVLDLPTHLSFPNIVRRDGRVFVCPENCRSGKLDLYEYVRGQDSLVYVQQICDDAVWDATVTDLFGKNQLFAAKSDDRHLDIYDWDESKGRYILEQTVESDIRNLRMAGQLFEYGSNIYMPNQNCEGAYGGAVDIKRISYDSQSDRFSLEYVKRLCDISPYRRGLHTLNSYKGWVVIDAKEFDCTLGPFFAAVVKSLKLQSHSFSK